MAALTGIVKAALTKKNVSTIVRIGEGMRDAP